MPFGNGGPAQKTGVYHSSDGSLRVRFDALQRGNRRILAADLRGGFLSFDADRMLFIAFVEQGSLDPTQCLRFVQVKRGTITLKDRTRVRQLAVNQPNPLTPNWTIDDIGGDGQLNSANRRDGLVSTSTCDRPSSEGIYPYEVSMNYDVEFILYVVNCCVPRAEKRVQRKGAANAATGRQILFALPWSIQIRGRVAFGGQAAMASYDQEMGDVQVAAPEQSLAPVIPAVADARICRPIRLRTGRSTCG
jgi:hypothetical protein